MMMNKDTNENVASYTVADSRPLLEWLLANVKGLSHSKIKAALKGGGVAVNGKRRTQFDYPLQEGDNIDISRSRKNAVSPSAHYLDLVYEDRFLVVIDKKVGVLSMAAGHSSLNVKNILDDYFHRSRQRCTAHVVHRLDRETSGLMIYAKDVATEQTLEHNWHDIVYDRRYIAVLSGEPSLDEGTIASWLKDNNAFYTYSSPVDNGGKYAVTHFRVLRRAGGRSLVEFKLETGRKNQIRVHSADMGTPVCGDVKYGNGDNPIGRLCLHACRLCFVHPVTGRRMEFETPIPTQFMKLFK